MTQVSVVSVKSAGNCFVELQKRGGGASPVAEAWPVKSSIFLETRVSIMFIEAGRHTI